MITDILIILCVLLLKAVNFAIPNWTATEDLTNAMFYMLNKALSFNQIIPINDLLIAIGIILTFHFVLFIIRAVTTAMTLFRGGGQSLDV